MAVPLLLELGRNPSMIQKDIWCADSPELFSDAVLGSLSQLHAQVKVQRVLQTTAKLLRQYPSNKSLPNQQSHRVRHLVKFVFEKTNRGTERQLRLRKLDCNALKLCGLSYKIRDILELTSMEFDILLASVADFIYRQKLTLHLYREDINKIIGGEFDPEDEELFKEFQKSHVDLRPTKWKRHNPPMTDIEEDKASIGHDVPRDAAGTPSSQGEDSGRSGKRRLAEDDFVSRELLPKRPRTASHQITGNLALLRDGEYCAFSFMGRHIIENVPEPVRTGMEESNLWAEEEGRGGLAVTNCLSMYIPETLGEDALLVVRVAYKCGWKFCNLFGLGDPYNLD